jgi:hypothetical protein
VRSVSNTLAYAGLQPVRTPHARPFPPAFR